MFCENFLFAVGADALPSDGHEDVELPPSARKQAQAKRVSQCSERGLLFSVRF